MIRLHPNDPPLTATETARVGVLIARMAKRELAGPDVHQADLQRRVDRVLDGARKRQEKTAKKK